MIQELLQDFSETLCALPRNHPRRQSLSVIARALELSAAAFADDPLQIAAQLQGRLNGWRSDEIRSLLEASSPSLRSSLRPITRSLTSPGQGLLRVARVSDAEVSDLIVIPHRMLVASADGYVCVWDLRKRASVATFPAHRDEINEVSISKDGAIAVTVSRDRCLRVWDLRKGALVTTFAGDSEFWSCDLISDGLVVIAGDARGTLHFLRHSAGESAFSAEQ